MQRKTKKYSNKSQLDSTDSANNEVFCLHCRYHKFQRTATQFKFTDHCRHWFAFVHCISFTERLHRQEKQQCPFDLFSKTFDARVQQRWSTHAIESYRERYCTNSLRVFLVARFHFAAVDEQATPDNGPESVRKWFFSALLNFSRLRNAFLVRFHWRTYLVFKIHVSALIHADAHARRAHTYHTHALIWNNDILYFSAQLTLLAPGTHSFEFFRSFFSRFIYSRLANALKALKQGFRSFRVAYTWMHKKWDTRMIN